MIGWNGVAWIRLWRNWALTLDGEALCHNVFPRSLTLSELMASSVVKLPRLAVFVKVTPFPLNSSFCTLKVYRQWLKKPWKWVKWRAFPSAGGVLGYPTFFFADNSIVFYKASTEECDALQQILCVYKNTTGQQLNRSKTSFFFSPNTSEMTKNEIKNRFGAQVIKQHEKYLGLPSLIGWNKKKSFREIKDRLAGKLAGWKEKHLSKAGKEVLIKVVARVISTYAMSYFKIPNSLCDEMTSLIRNFWWGQR